jgi:hypothetical protein
VLKCVEPRQGASKQKPATYTYGAYLASRPQLIWMHLASCSRMSLSDVPFCNLQDFPSLYRFAGPLVSIAVAIPGSISVATYR